MNSGAALAAPAERRSSGKEIQSDSLGDGRWKNPRTRYEWVGGALEGHRINLLRLTLSMPANQTSGVSVIGAVPLT